MGSGNEEEFWYSLFDHHHGKYKINAAFADQRAFKFSHTINLRHTFLSFYRYEK
jgi:hypothetical protein